ncbi:transposase [Ensifer adhaerens]|uniref:transposase n=1 Tax=Ensifer adhaerens TaxID=106592 RepID=UPI000AF15500|nr:transposase [Ensifer adhaerens]
MGSVLHGSARTTPRSTRKNPPPCDYTAYKDRNRIERMFNRMKQFRRIATCYEKTKASFAAFLALVAVKLWLPTICKHVWESDCSQP